MRAREKADGDMSTVCRAMRILQLLKGHSLAGLALTQIAKELDALPSTAHRTLEAMAREEMVVQFDSKRWALSVRMLGIAAAHESEMQRALTRTNELAQRVRAEAAV